MTHSEPPLTFSTLLVAMLADEDTWLKKHFEAQGVSFAAIAQKRSYDEASLRRLDEHGLEPEYLTTISARQALEEARRIATRSSGSTTVDARHLMRGLSRPARIGTTRTSRNSRSTDSSGRAAFAREMARRFPAERTYWRGYADRASPVPLTSFSADVYTERICSASTAVSTRSRCSSPRRGPVTPLAIGVFGPWGSGKSFFMRHLKKRIIGLRRDEQPRIADWMAKREEGSATRNDAPLYSAEIAQVEFNAWHYNEGEPRREPRRASLSQSPFPAEAGGRPGARGAARRPAETDSMCWSRGEDDRRDDRGGRKENVPRRERRRRAANQAVNEARRRASMRTRARSTARSERRPPARKLDEAVRAIELKPGEVDPDAIVAVGVRPLAPLFGEVKATIAAAQNSVFDWKEFLAPRIHGEGSGGRRPVRRGANHCRT